MEFKEKPPTVSVVLPVFNGERHLPEAIESILNQTFTDFELIVIDDGSSDRSSEIVKSYKDPRIKLLCNNINKGVVHSLNYGLSEAKGEFVARMDSDDISLPHRFSKQMEVFNTYKGVDIVNSHYLYMSEDSSVVREQISTYRVSFEAIKHLIVLQNCICHPVVMVKRAAIVKFLYSESTGAKHIEDFDLWNRMLNDGCICYTIETPLLLYRSNPQSVTHTKTEQITKLQTSLSEYWLKKRYGIVCNKETLKAMIQESSEFHLTSLLKLNRELQSLFQMINDRTVLTSSSLNELHDWRKQKMLLLSLKSLRNGKIPQKLLMTLFLLYHTRWLTSKNVRRFLFKALFPNTSQIRLESLLGKINEKNSGK